jgi:hypothetical protein
MAESRRKFDQDFKEGAAPWNVLTRPRRIMIVPARREYQGCARRLPYGIG